MADIDSNPSDVRQDLPVPAQPEWGGGPLGAAEWWRGQRVRATGRAMSAARLLRRQLTLPELLLWRALSPSRRALRFRKQHPIGPFVADFYCPAAKVVIEVDGAIHDLRQDDDKRRDAYLAGLGLTVIRIAATDVLANPVAVADSLFRFCADRVGPSTTQPDG